MLKYLVHLLASLSELYTGRQDIGLPRKVSVAQPDPLVQRLYVQISIQYGSRICVLDHTAADLRKPVNTGHASTATPENDNLLEC